LRRSAASAKSFMLVRRWWYVLKMALAWILSMDEGGRRGFRRRIIADALRDEVCVSKFMARWIRMVGSRGLITKGGSLGHGKKSPSMILGSTDIRSNEWGLIDLSSVGGRMGAFGAEASCSRKRGGDDGR
jgi:hypothetical protein